MSKEPFFGPAVDLKAIGWFTVAFILGVVILAVTIGPFLIL